MISGMLVIFSLILTLVCQGNPCTWLSGSISKLSGSIQTAAIAHSYRAFASHSEVWMFESQPGQSLATGVSVTGP